MEAAPSRGMCLGSGGRFLNDEFFECYLFIWNNVISGGSVTPTRECSVSPTGDMRWVKIAATGDVPGGRASHSSAVFRDHMYIFGGIGPEGTLDTTYKYHTGRETSQLCHSQHQQAGSTFPPWLLGAGIALE